MLTPTRTLRHKGETLRPGVTRLAPHHEAIHELGARNFEPVRAKRTRRSRVAPRATRLPREQELAERRRRLRDIGATPPTLAERRRRLRHLDAQSDGWLARARRLDYIESDRAERRQTDALETFRVVFGV